jgi:hypothetical protein
MDRGAVPADEFGRDPSVLRTRRVFGLIEARQGELLAAAGLSPLDERLRYCRERARMVFEKAWARAAGRSPELTDEDLAALYVRCLARMLMGRGVTVPEEAVPESEAVARALQEVLP